MKGFGLMALAAGILGAVVGARPAREKRIAAREQDACRRHFALTKAERKREARIERNKRLQGGAK